MNEAVNIPEVVNPAPECFFSATQGCLRTHAHTALHDGTPVRVLTVLYRPHSGLQLITFFLQ